MEIIINFDGVSYAKGGKVILNNLNFDIERGSIVSIIGPNGCGKSSLVSVLAGLYEYNGYIAMNGYYLNKDNMRDIRRFTSVLLDDINNLPVTEIVGDELSVGLNNLGENDLDINKRVMDVARLFKIDNILNRGIKTITNSERVKVFLASSIVTNPDILIIDDCLHQLSVVDKKLVFDIFKKYNKNNNLTIIMVTHNMEDTLYSDRVILLDKGNVVMDDSPIHVFKDKEKLANYGIKIPFVIELSLKLLNKGVVNHVYKDMGKLVDDIWK